jgi:uncharacterized protein YjbI with pentapeptide repeats
MNKIQQPRPRWNRLFDLTGFRGKTLWDLLGLLIVPVVIALAVWYLSEVSRQNQQQIEDQRAKAEQDIEDQRAKAQQQIEDDRVRDSVLQSYIQDMTGLLLDRRLADSVPNDPIRDIARSSTLTAIRQLDSYRKGILLQFLSESNLIKTDIDPIIYLFGADLRGADLRGADLRGTNLSRANLSSANLVGTNLFRADLSGANLSGAILNPAVLSGANLSGANLSGANLSGANLNGANLSGANLVGTNLFRADLSNAGLSDANLSDAVLSGADLSRADLSGAILNPANLSGAVLRLARRWTNEQLAEAEYLVGATLPDGKVMTEEDWEEFKKRYRQ